MKQQRASRVRGEVAGTCDHYETNGSEIFEMQWLTLGRDEQGKGHFSCHGWTALDQRPPWTFSHDTYCVAFEVEAALSWGGKTEEGERGRRREGEQGRAK